MNYVIQKSAKADPMIVHVDKLKMFEGVTPVSWLLPFGESRIVDRGDITSITDQAAEEDEAIDTESDVELLAGVTDASHMAVENSSVSPVVDENDRPRRKTGKPRWLDDFVSS